MNFEKITKKQTLILLITILLVLIVLNALLKSFRETSDEKKIDYKTANASSLIADSEEVADRTVYVKIEQVLTEYLNSYISNDSSKDYKKYYSMLDKKYKRSIGKKKYEEVSNNFLNKFKIVGAITGKELMITNEIVKGVYEFDKNKYICMLENDRNENAYIGIRLDYETNNAYIFYIE